MRLKFSTRLPSSVDTVWNEVTKMDGVNAELYPLLKMTYPSESKGLTIQDAPLNKFLFTSVLLLFLFIPIDLHFLKLKKVRHGEFVEESSSLIQKKWIHHRTVIKDPHNNKGCIVTDELEWNTRLFGIANWILYPILYVIFWNRHRRLNQLYLY